MSSGEKDKGLSGVVKDCMRGAGCVVGEDASTEISGERENGMNNNSNVDAMAKRLVFFSMVKTITS